MRVAGLRSWLFVAVALVSATCGETAIASRFANPIVEASPRTGSADPSVVFHRGYYYYCRSLDDAAIGVARARRLQDIGAATPVVVFRPPPHAPFSRQIWAPELQRIRGRWTIYFAASDGSNASHHMYAIVSESDDPQGRYAFKGRVDGGDDAWEIDGAALELHGALYFVWSGWPRHGDFPQVLYIAAMRDPWTVVGARHAIAIPELDWERAGAPLLESPEPLHHDGNTFIVYSAAASWSDDYALGVLRYVGGDPLRAGSWRKSPLPVFGKSAAASAFGVGHPSFVRSPDGREDWIVYHAMARSGAGWSGRSVRAQPFGWCADGTPFFGSPVAAGRAIEEPSGTPGAGTTRATISAPC